MALPVAAVAAAEVLQVRGPGLLQVGDRNRSMPVAISCLDVEAEAAPEATEWLRQELPRGTRVNLRPRGSSDGVLLADVTRLDDGSDMAEAMELAGLARRPCTEPA
nr:nuclease [Synechococcus sp. RSCCF101]